MKSMVVVIALVLALTADAGAATTRSPRGLYMSLLTMQFSDSELPSGFFAAKVSLGTAGPIARRHHVIGEVDVEVDGPDPVDFIEYAVFPTPGDAAAQLREQKNPGGGSHVTVMGRVPGYSLRTSCWASGSITGKNVFGKKITDGATALYLVQGSVLIDVATDSGSNETSGDIPAALQLLKAASRHLVAISG